MQTMIHIPEELLEQAERGNVLLFVGERVVRDAGGQVVLDQLTAQLVARGGSVDTGDITFPEAAQIYEDTAGRQALIQFLRDQFEALGDDPQPVHRLIAGLADCNLMVTTCLDQRLERAFKEAGRPLDVITGTIDIAFEDERKPRLYRLRGALDRAESLVLTEDDYETFFEDQSSISVVLQSYLARKTILFVGYDLADAQFKHLYRKVTAALDDYARRAYAFSKELDLKAARWCDRHKISVIEIDGAVLLEALSGQLASRLRPTLIQASRRDDGYQSPLPEHPYKLLDYYESDDAAIFFGRQQEAQTLSALIHAHRLVLLYGASGVGKTSLLLAGAVPRLEHTDPPYTALSVRALEDPALVIRRAVHRQIPEAALPENGSLLDFLATTTRTIGGPLVIVLDQFEEFFIRLSPQFRAAFVSELGALYDARDVPVKIVLSLREDWLAAVGEIEGRIPEIFRVRQRLLPLTREQAREAITAPVERMGINYEPALVERLLDDLVGSMGATVMPPQLQLVCSALYSGLKLGEHVIGLAAYERLGGARGVLQQYLDDELARLGRDERALAQSILEELVTSQGTKAVKVADDLAMALDVDSALLPPVLEKLVRARLLRALERDGGGTAYELAHEYLIREIGLGAEAKARKQAEELIKQEVENWQRFGTLLAADKLALIGEARAVLRLSPEAQELLLHSALQVGDEIEYWLRRVSDPERRVAVIVAETRGKLAVVRRRAAQVLGTQDVPESVEPLLELTLLDSDRTVRLAARASLTALAVQRPTIVARLQPELANENRRVRRAAIRTLSTLPLRELPRGLRTRALATRLNLGASWLVEQSVTTPIRRAMVVTAALLLVFVGIAYVFSANSYYVDTRPSVPGQNVIVVRRGHPLLKLPGIGQEEVDSGIDEALVANSHWEEVHSEQLSGLRMQVDTRGYQHWFEGVLGALRMEGQAPLLWYLKRQDEAFQNVLKATDLQEPQARRWRAQALGQVGAVNSAMATPQARDELVSLLKDQAPEVRANAAAALGQLATTNHALTSPQIMDALMGLIDDPNYEVQSSVTGSIAQVIAANPALATSQIAEALVEQSLQRNSQARAQAVHLLSYVVRANLELAPDVLETLVVRLEDTDSSVRISTAYALGQLGAVNSSFATDSMVMRLNVLLEDTDSNVRASAVDTLGRLGAANHVLATAQLADRLNVFLEDPDTDVRASAAGALSELAQANHMLATAPLVDRLGTLLGSSDSNVRYRAVYALQRLASIESIARQVAPKLIQFLKDPKEETYMRSQAAYTLDALIKADVALANQQMEDMLIGLLKEQDEELGFSVASALSQLVASNNALAPHVVGTLTSLLKDPDKRLRARAVSALGQIIAIDTTLSNAQLNELLIDLIADQDDEVRANAVYAIGQVVSASPILVPPKVSEALSALLKDQSSTVRVAAREALEKIYIHQTLRLGATDDIYFAKLVDPLNALERPIAAQVLFSTVLHNPARSQTIRRRLLSEPFTPGHDPIAQVWVNKTLALIDLADIAHSATSNVGQWDTNASKLELFGSFDNQDFYYGPDAKFFESFVGTDFVSAARAAQDWMKQRATREKE